MSDLYDGSVLEVLKCITGVMGVGGGPVPMPNAHGEVSEHLFVNLSLGALIQGENMSALAERLRTIACDALVLLRAEPRALQYSTIIVSLFTPISPTEGLRIYRTRLKTEDLWRLKRENWREVVMGEVSGMRELHEVLHLPK